MASITTEFYRTQLNNLVSMNSNRHNYYTRQTNDLEVNTENVENAYKFFSFHGVGNSSVTELNLEQFGALLLVVLHKRLVLSGNYVMPRVLLTETIMEKTCFVFN